MNKLPVAIALLLAGILPLAAGADPEVREHVVGPDAPFASLAEALAAAAPGERIRVLPGHYREGPLVVDKPVEILGEGYPLFDGEDAHSVLTIRSDHVVIRGLRIENAGVSHLQEHAGIRVEDSKHCTLEENRLYGNFFGIYLAGSSQCRVAGNEIRAEQVREINSGNGIHLWKSRDIVLEGNQVSGHRDGIYLEFVEDTRILRNFSRHNLRYGLHFMFSDRCEYRGNTFRNNGAGVAVMYTRRVLMEDNRFEDNRGTASYGLLLKDISDSEIRGNRFLRNTVGVFADNSNRLTFERNHFESNGWAVRIMGSCLDNHFQHNNFIENTFDVATNSRKPTGNTFLENYWSQYQGYDFDRNGFGDVPYRPVRFFSLMAEREPIALLLLRSFFVHLLDLAERVLPVLTPEALEDPRPRMERVS